MCTAVREVKEELNLDVRTAERLHTFDFNSTYYAHKVSLLTTDQEPVVNSKEILEFIWWHPDSSLVVAPSVRTLWERIVSAGLIASADVPGGNGTPRFLTAWKLSLIPTALPHAEIPWWSSWSSLPTPSTNFSRIDRPDNTTVSQTDNQDARQVITKVVECFDRFRIED